MRFIVLGLVLFAVAVNAKPSSDDKQEKIKNYEKAIDSMKKQHKQMEEKFEKNKQEHLGEMDTAVEEENLKAHEYMIKKGEHDLRKLKSEKRPEHPTEKELQEEIANLEMAVKTLKERFQQLKEDNVHEYKAFAYRQGWKALQNVLLGFHYIELARESQLNSLKGMRD